MGGAVVKQHRHDEEDERKQQTQNQLSEALQLFAHSAASEFGASAESSQDPRGSEEELQSDA